MIHSFGTLPEVPLTFQKKFLDNKAFSNHQLVDGRFIVT